LEVGLRPKKKVAKYSGQPRPETNFSVRPWGGAKFISSPWAQKWLATALLEPVVKQNENQKGHLSKESDHTQHHFVKKCHKSGKAASLSVLVK
jgi:hypothetical protein